MAFGDGDGRERTIARAAGWRRRPGVAAAHLSGGRGAVFEHYLPTRRFRSRRYKPVPSLPLTRQLSLILVNEWSEAPRKPTLPAEPSPAKGEIKTAVSI